MIPRAALAAAGLAGLALAFPGPGVLGVVLTAGGLAALVVSVARPRSAAPAVLIAALVTEWLVTGASAGVPRGIGLAAALAAVHLSAALAAEVPPGARPAPRLLLPWALRWGAISAAGVLVVLGTAVLPSSPAPVATALGATVLLVAAAVGGARLAQRPPLGGAAGRGPDDGAARRSGGQTAPAEPT